MITCKTNSNKRNDLPKHLGDRKDNASCVYRCYFETICGSTQGTLLHIGHSTMVSEETIQANCSFIDYDTIVLVYVETFMRFHIHVHNVDIYIYKYMYK